MTTWKFPGRRAEAGATRKELPDRSSCKVTAIRCSSVMFGSSRSLRGFAGSLQETAHAEPMCGVVRPGGDLRALHRPQTVPVAAVSVHVKFGGNAVLLQFGIKQHRAQRRRS